MTAGNDEPERLDYFAVTAAAFERRQNIREPIDPYLHLRLLSTTAPPAELRLSFRAALDLIEQVAQQLAGQTRRWDISNALSRTSPLPLETKEDT